jgi:hypothetical protein
MSAIAARDLQAADIEAADDSRQQLAPALLGIG